MRRTLVLVLVLAIPLSTSQAQPTRDKNEDSNHASQATRQTKKELADSFPVTVYSAVDTPPPNDPSQTIAGNGSGDPHGWPEYVNACSTLVIAVFTIALFIGVLVQIWTSRAIERAWVVVDIRHEDSQLETTTKIGDVVDETTSVPLTCISLNGGKSPAWVIEKRIRFEIFENPEAIPKTPPLERTTVFDDVPHTVYTREHSVKADMPVAQGRLNERNVGVLYGVVSYRDIFNNIRRTTFGYKVLPVADRLSLRLERLKNRPKYNENT
jgi:hypothetical protein